jgi:hypothetical protein
LAAAPSISTASADKLATAVADEDPGTVESRMKRLDLVDHNPQNMTYI